MNLSLFDIVSIFGALIVLAVSMHLFFSKREKHVTNLIFICFLLMFATSSLYDILYRSDRITPLVFLESTMYAWPPLFYLYTRSFIQNTKKLAVNDYFHFLPAVVSAIIFLCIGSIYKGVEESWFNALPWTATFFTSIDLVLNCQFALYLGLSIDKLRQYKFWLESHYSTTEQLGLTWINRFILGILVIFASNFLLFGFDIPLFETHYPQYVSDWFHVGITLLAVWAALYSLLTPEIFNCHLRFIHEEDTDTKADNKTNKKFVDDQKQDENLTKTLKQLNKIMYQDKPYLDPNMGLNDLAEKINLTPKKLSQLLNQKLNQSFYTYVNYYRIEEVKARLSKAENRNAKLEGIAIDSGFRSTSTFNRLFKQQTRMTPQQFRVKQLITA